MQIEFWGEERREKMDQLERFESFLMQQQISCEASVSPRVHHKAARYSPRPGPTLCTNRHRSIIYEHLTAAV